MIVPVYNEQFLLEASLARLRVLSDTALLEAVKIIVADDGSSDQAAGADPNRYRTQSKTPCLFESFAYAVSSERDARPRYLDQ